MISEDYKAQLTEFHQTQPDFGNGSNSGPMVSGIIKYIYDNNVRSLLDYGCGKGRLEQILRQQFDASQLYIKSYDPAVPGFNTLEAGAFDLVVCTDVMEHVEPEYNYEVLAHIQEHAKGGVLFSICLVPARKTLPDGRNAHINLSDINTWVGRIMVYFDLVSVSSTSTMLGVECKTFLKSS